MGCYPGADVAVGLRRLRRAGGGAGAGGDFMKQRPNVVEAWLETELDIGTIETQDVSRTRR